VSPFEYFDKWWLPEQSPEEGCHGTLRLRESAGDGRAIRGGSRMHHTACPRPPHAAGLPSPPSGVSPSDPRTRPRRTQHRARTDPRPQQLPLIREPLPVPAIHHAHRSDDLRRHRPELPDRLIRRFDPRFHQLLADPLIAQLGPHP
jgi:hypothetical protein